MSALQLFGVAAMDGERGIPLTADTQLVAFRDLGAIVAEVPYARMESDPEALERFRRTVEEVFQTHDVLPAPFGVVFRTRESLLRWMELHYVVLADGLSFIEGRAAGRVHLSRGERIRARGEDLGSGASEVFRNLKRAAIAALPLKTDHEPTLLLSAAYLISRDRWGEFAEAVAEERGRHPELRFDFTGPWPPYDFVRMQFGG